MHATEIPKPFHRDGWVYEEKYDGWRMMVYRIDLSIRLVSRRGLDHTKRSPSLAKAIAVLPVRAGDGQTLSPMRRKKRGSCQTSSSRKCTGGRLALVHLHLLQEVDA